MNLNTQFKPDLSGKIWNLVGSLLETALDDKTFPDFGFELWVFDNSYREVYNLVTHLCLDSLEVLNET